MPNVDPVRRRHRQAVPPDPTDIFANAAVSLRAAEHVCILTGAGVSAESGIPTFRDALTGLWAKYQADELATAQAFERNPQLVWTWYAERRAQVRAAQPNSAHLALASLTRFVSHCSLITQNVDDLHARAGSRDIISLHGSIMRVRCSANCGYAVDDYVDVGTSVPKCPQCKSLLRPDVVWFGEQLPPAALTAAQAATLACDVFISIGTSNIVEPAASLPWLAARHGATVIIVNPVMDRQRTGPSILPLVGNAGSVVPALVQRAFAGRRPRVRPLEGGESVEDADADELDVGEAEPAY